MNFIDHTGHIFSLASYDSQPIGYEYETFNYVFYLEDDYARRLSVGNYYIRPIRVLLDRKVQSVDLSVDSSVFSLINKDVIEAKVKATHSLHIDIDEDDIRAKELHITDFYRDKDYALCTFYIIGYTDEAATWTTNVLIKATYEDREDYCPITVGGVFHDECEELVINGRNMGVYLPKDILDAVYGGKSVYSDNINEATYSNKVKEYLLNYMKLHGETGNLSQMVSALKWFDWGSKIDIVQLVRTDNDILTQYIRDFLNTDTDLLIRFEHFQHSGLVSLYVDINGETGEVNEQEFDKDLWGEGKPILESYLDKMIAKQYDEQTVTYWKPYFDYLLPELMLKIAALRHFYQKYFLPMHVMCLSASVRTQTYANDVKLVNRPFLQITECPIAFEDDRTRFTVEFPKTDTIFAYTQTHYVDDHYNEFDVYIPETKDGDVDYDVYYINDICAAVPIKFIPKDENCDFFRCHLILQRFGDNPGGGTVMYESDFSFAPSKEEYRNLVIFPRLMNDRFTMNYWLDKHYMIHLNVNDIWFSYEFYLTVPEMHLKFGKLKYRYDERLFRQVNRIIKDENDKYVVDFNAFMYMPSLVDVSNINFPTDVLDYGNDEQMQRFLRMYSESPSLPSEHSQISRKYYNRVHLFKLLKETSKNVWEEILYSQRESDDPTYDNTGNMLSSVLTDDETNLYRMLFNDDGTQKEKVYNGRMKYDMYLMHDSPDLSDYIDVLLTQDEFNIITEYLEKGITETEPEVSTLEAPLVQVFPSYPFINPEDFRDPETGEIDQEALDEALGQRPNTDGYEIDTHPHYHGPDVDCDGACGPAEPEAPANDFEANHPELYKKWLDITTSMFPRWYIVLISKNTIDEATQMSELDAPEIELPEGFKAEYVSSDNKWLINRMAYVPTHGINHFETNDIICGTINNVQLPFILTHGTKWNITPFSLGMEKDATVTSTTNTFIMSMGGDNEGYERGYYNLTVRYSIDGTIQNQRTHRARILVK